MEQRSANMPPLDRQVCHVFGQAPGVRERPLFTEFWCSTAQRWTGAASNPYAHLVFHANAVGTEEDWHCVVCGHREGRG